MRLAPSILAVLAAAGCRAQDGEPPPALEPSGGETVYVVRDTGRRCVTHPCFHLTVLDADGRPVDEVSELDLGALRLDDAERDSVLAVLHDAGLRAAGAIVVEPDAGPAGDGRVFRVSRLVP